MNDPPWCAVSAMGSIGFLTRGTIISMAFVTAPEVAWIGTKNPFEQPDSGLPEVLQAVKQEPRFLADRFWPDGMVRVSGREFTGMVESPCYEKGSLSCLSCHQMHHPTGAEAISLEMISPPVFMAPRPVFNVMSPSRQTYRLTRITHWSPPAAIAQLPHAALTYGLMKAIRSHQIDVPRWIKVEKVSQRLQPLSSGSNSSWTPLIWRLVWSGQAGFASRRRTSCRSLHWL